MAPLSADLESVIGPRAHLKDAALRVIREVLDVDEAGRLVDGGRAPLHQPVEPQRRLCHQRHLVVPVGAATNTYALAGPLLHNTVLERTRILADRFVEMRNNANIMALLHRIVKSEGGGFT